MQDDAEATARTMVAKWEHGDEKHRQWLRDVATPDVYALTARVERLEAALRKLERYVAWEAMDALLYGDEGQIIGWDKTPKLSQLLEEARAALGDATE